MKSLIYLLIIGAITYGCQSPAEQNTTSSSYIGEVTEAVESLRKLLVDPEKNELEKLSSGILTYGHSNGVTESQSDFIQSLLDGKFNFETLELTDQTIEIAGETAIVRHRLTGTTNNAGQEPGMVDLHVLQVWQKQNNNWKLLARQAVRTPQG